MPASPRPGSSSGSSSGLLAEPRLHPGVEAGAEPGGRRRRPRHRPGQVAGERRRGRRAAGPATVADRLDGSGTAMSGERSRARLREQPVDLVVPLAAIWSSVRARRRASSSASAAASRTRAAAARGAASTSAVRCEIGQGRSGEAAAYGLGSPFGRLVEPGVGLAAPGRHRVRGSAGGTPTGRGRRLRCGAQQPRRDRQLVAGRGSSATYPSRSSSSASWALAASAQRRRCPPARARRAGAGRGRRRAAAPGITDGHGPASSTRVRLVGNLRSRHADQEHRVPLQALGPVHGQQLDRVGLGRRGDVEALAVVVLGLEPGQQRGQRDLRRRRPGTRPPPARTGRGCRGGRPRPG